MKVFFRTIILSLSLLVLLQIIPSTAPAAEPWREPGHWAAVGSVNKWLDIDNKLNHGRRGETIMTVASQKQKEYYERTLVFTGALPQVDLETFLDLPVSEQARRSEQAQRELMLVARWHQKLAAKATRVLRGPWSAGQTEVDEMAEVLEDLYNAVGVDPSNPYAWHLLGWLRAQVGDIEHSEEALQGAQLALALVPDDQLLDMRRRVALDRAWNLRNVGETGLALQQIRQAVELGGADFETNLLRGLLAALSGNMAEAEEFASRVENLGRFGREHGRHMNESMRELLAKQGPQMASSWILALTWLNLGYPEEAREAFPDWLLGKMRGTLPPFPHHFWRDAGYIYYALGQGHQARKSWERGLDFTPYHPFFVFRIYNAPMEGMAGMTTGLPFFLNFGLFPGSGSRFGYALTLARSLDSNSDAIAYGEMLTKVQDNLLVCLRCREFIPQVYLTLEHLYRKTGQLPQADSCREQAVRAFEFQGYTVDATKPGEMVQLKGRQPKALVKNVIKNPVSGTQVAWQGDRPVQETLDEIQDTYFAEQTPATRRILARFLIRNLQVDEGRELLLNGRGKDKGAGADVAAMADEDLVILLEADRQDGSDATARLLMDSLLANGAPQRTTSEIWALAGAIMLDLDDRAAGLTALRRAVELDPDNGGLQIQLLMLAE